MKNKIDKILNIVLIFIILQPFLDVLSFLSIREIIPFNISTYLKPLFVFLLCFYLLIRNFTKQKKWFIYIIIFIIFTIGHMYLLNRLLIDISVLLHEFRFIINISYMIALFIIFSCIIKEYEDKEALLKKLKRTILITFCLYFSILLFAIITNTSALTYEYADELKRGYKGYFDSGQILGHAFSIVFPMLIYIILSPKRLWYYRIIILLIIASGVSLIGTKVPYYIFIIVLILYLLITFIIKIFNKEHQKNYFNIILVFIILISIFITYKYTPVKYNTDINNQVGNINIDEYNLEDESGMDDILSLEELKEKYPNKDITYLFEYQNLNSKASEYLIKLFEDGKLHPSNMRFKQINYASKKFQLAPLEYKIFGLGFLNQDTSLALESDFFMALFSFGILGFCLFLIIPLKVFIKTTIFIFKNLKIIDLETYMLYMGLGIFFCISIYAGYTFIYTNFSIFLMTLIALLEIKQYLLKKNKIEKKKVSFLLLHLGYGGIETATINTANSLCDKYKVELISFYNLKNNQESRINKKITIKYLYNSEPNKEEFLTCFKKRQVFKLLKEGIKAINILIKKKVLIIKEIINSNSSSLISTRSEFSILLSKYGFQEVLKIAVEHHYHNNDNKYINVLKHKYYNIDYLFALTKTLQRDYQRFLKHNKHTKVVLVPNMLFDLPDKKSDVSKKNIITMSRLDPGKRIDEIIKIFSKTKNKSSWNLYILGDGKEYLKLNNLINELNLNDNVKLEGYISKEKLPDYLLNSSIFLMTSITEGLPMVLLEAMSYGIPCIAYEIPSGVNDIIDNNENGFVIKGRCKEEYLKCLDKLMDDSKLRKSFSNKAIMKSLEFNKEKIIEKWYSILK